MCQQKNVDLLDIFFKASTIAIAATNLILVVRFFVLKNSRDEKEKEKDRKIEWLKTLVLDHSLERFYEFFDRLESDLSNLKQPNLSDEGKRAIDEKNGDSFIYLRREFTDTLLAIDEDLYTKVLEISDGLQQKITTTIFDNGINLAYLPKYEETILKELSLAKTEVIKIIFNYRG